MIGIVLIMGKRYRAMMLQSMKRVNNSLSQTTQQVM